MKAIIFDLDGTLIDSAPDIHAAVNRLLDSEGLPPLPFAQVKGFIGNGVGVLLSRVMAAAGMGEDPGLHQALMGRFLHDYETAVALTRLYPGVAEALETLARQGWALGLCTNKPIAPTRAVLTHFGLQDSFVSVIGGDSLPQRKPDPAPLRAVMTALDAGPAVYVGDSEVDAECAHRTGLPMALFTEGYRKTPVESLPHAAAFDHFRHLPEIAGRLIA